MSRTLTERLSEMQAYMQQERERISRQLVSERDDAVRQTEAAFAGRFDGVRIEATQWLEELQRKAAEVIEDAKKVTEGAQRDVNLARQREVSRMSVLT